MRVGRTPALWDTDFHGSLESIFPACRARFTSGVPVSSNFSHGQSTSASSLFALSKSA